MSKRKKPAPTTSESVLDDVLDTMRAGVAHIRTEIEKIAKGKAEKTGHDRASRIAFLTAKVGAIADSLRKVEAAKAKRKDQLTPDDVIAYVRALDPQDRTRLLRDLAELDNRKSGLA